MKQKRGLDRNSVLRPTPGDPWHVEQHRWNTGAKENQQLNPLNPVNQKLSTGEPAVKHYSLCNRMYRSESSPKLLQQLNPVNQKLSPGEPTVKHYSLCNREDLDLDTLGAYIIV